MKAPLQDLWDSVVPLDGPGPVPRPQQVARKVNTVLDAVPSERKRHMKQKLRTAAVLAAAIVILTCSAWAVAKNWTVLDAFFAGSSQVGQSLMDTQTYAVSDGSYTLTVTSSLADGNTAYLTFTLEAQTSEAAKQLMNETFTDMEDFDVSFPQQAWPDDETVTSSFALSEEVSLRTDASRTWNMKLTAPGIMPETVSIRAGILEEGLWLEVPLTVIEARTVEIHASGTGTGTLSHAAGGPVTLESVSLTPLGLSMHYTYDVSGGEGQPVLTFLGTDGTMYGQSQLLSGSSSEYTANRDGDTVTATVSYAFRQIQDLAQLEAIVFENTAYPLNGGKPYAVDSSAVPAPFQLPLMEATGDAGGYSVPVRALCEGLGISCQWDSASRSATMTFRNTTLTLTVGTSTAKVNGKEIPLYNPTGLQNGCLVADSEAFIQAWGLNLYAAMENLNAGLVDSAAWVVIP